METPAAQLDNFSALVTGIKERAELVLEGASCFGVVLESWIFLAVVNSRLKLATLLGARAAWEGGRRGAGARDGLYGLAGSSACWGESLGSLLLNAQGLWWKQEAGLSRALVFPYVICAAIGCKGTYLASFARQILDYLSTKAGGGTVHGDGRFSAGVYGGGMVTLSGLALVGLPWEGSLLCSVAFGLLRIPSISSYNLSH
ncbi:hypothetical protein Tco_0720806 [Tanacetum coccineum]